MGWPGPMTHRQFEVWCDWLDEQYNYPTLTDQYLMQIAMEVRTSWVKNKSGPKMRHFRLRFEKPKERAKLTETERRAALEANKAKWIALVGGREKVKVVKSNGLLDASDNGSE